MLDFDILEKKCKAYRRKKFLSVFVVITVVLILLAIPSYFIYMYKYDSVAKAVKKPLQQQEILKHSPMQPMKAFPIVIKRYDTPKWENKEPVVKKVERKVEKKNVTQKKEVQKSSLVSPSNVTIAKLEEVFTRRKTYGIAIKISKKYFKKKEYKKSLAWAKKANALNKEDEDSWILYAKSRYALGDVKSAKEILEFYLGYKNSKTAKMLLENWNRK